MIEPVLVERRGTVQWITINRPDRRNALNEAVIAAVTAGVRQAMGDPSARAIVLTGAGDKAFCAGGDLAPTAEGAPFRLEPAQPRHYIAELLRLFETCDLPTIARVNGHALAGGLGLVCACDLAVAADDASFGTPEAKVGLYPMMIMPYLLRILPRRRFMELCITGESISARDALEMGLINYVAPRAELDAKLDWLLGRILDKSPTAVRLGKYAFHAMQDMSVPESLAYAQLMLPMMSQTEDAREGFRAFGEKRSPKWPGA